MLTFNRAAGTTKISCDGCPTSLESVLTTDQRAGQQRAAEIAKVARWKLERHAGAWQHFCPSCAQSRNRGKLL